MDISNVFDFSNDPQLVSMLCRLFGSFRSILAQTELGSFFTLHSSKSYSYPNRYSYSNAHCYGNGKPVSADETDSMNNEHFCFGRVFP